MNFRSLVIALSTCLALGTVAVAGDAKVTRIDKTEVKFLAVGPAGLKINGTGSDVNVDEQDGKYVLTTSLKDLKTGIGLRDQHLKKYIASDKHPQAKLVVAKDQIKLPEDNKESTGSAKGQLTLHGVTKPVAFNYKIKRTGSDYHVQAMFDVDITKHDIEKPCYLGVCVDQNVKVKVRLKVRDK